MCQTCQTPLVMLFCPPHSIFCSPLTHDACAAARLPSRFGSIFSSVGGQPLEVTLIARRNTARIGEQGGSAVCCPLCCCHCGDQSPVTTGGWQQWASMMEGLAPISFWCQAKFSQLPLYMLVVTIRTWYCYFDCSLCHVPPHQCVSAGTRMWRRGADSSGAIANLVETEQVRPHKASHLHFAAAWGGATSTGKECHTVCCSLIRSGTWLIGLS